MSQKWWLGLDKNDDESLVRKDIVCESHESISNESFRKNSVSSIIPEQIYLNEKNKKRESIDSSSVISESKPVEGAFVKLDRKPDIVSIPIVTTIYINTEHSQSSVFTHSIEQLEAEKPVEKEKKNVSPIRKIYTMLFSSKNASKKLS
jgi:hypothetical protein